MTKLADATVAIRVVKYGLSWRATREGSESPFGVGSSPGKACDALEWNERPPVPHVPYTGTLDYTTLGGKTFPNLLPSVTIRVERDDSFVDDAIRDAREGATFTIYTEDQEYIRTRVRKLCPDDHEVILSRILFAPYDQAPG